MTDEARPSMPQIVGSIAAGGSSSSQSDSGPAERLLAEPRHSGDGVGHMTAVDLAERLRTCRLCGIEFCLSPRDARTICYDCKNKQVRERFADPIERAKRRAQQRAVNVRRRQNPVYLAKIAALAKVRTVRHYHDKDYARRLLNEAVMAGVIQRPTKCEGCGVETKPHGHHEDYNKPLEVIWLCRKCHGTRHRKDR